MRLQVPFNILLILLILFLSHQTSPQIHIKKFNKKLNRLYLILFVPVFMSSFLFTDNSFPQEVTGKIEGRIVDENGSAIIGVVISASSSSLQGTRTTQTNKDGFYRCILLPPGFYTLKFSHVSYKPITIDNVQVRLGKTSSIGELIMIENPYELEEILVKDSRSLIDPGSTAIGGNFSKNEIEPLPLQRDYQYIPLLLPQINTSFYGDKFSSTGASGIENRYLIDGIEVNS